ncbi:MAG TPA: MauE/DoxX family redox-associated membrane protein [Solirubrobacteraceae bacterium]|nr:MauE/DoxX family redox-associated membrane protein [Solirubrobacteraceae bacterium]
MVLVLIAAADGGRTAGLVAGALTGAVVGALAGVVVGALGLLLLAAGYAKLRHPAPATEALRAAGAPVPGALTRLLAIAEIAIGIAALAVPAPVGPLLVAIAFGGLGFGAAFAGRGGRQVACGCFGDDEALLGHRHTIVNLSGAAAAATVAAAGLRSGWPAAGGHPSAAAAGLALAVVLALALRGALRGASGLEPAPGRRLVEASARALEARFSRRSALIRLAVGGSALSIAPLRYLLYPGTALAVVVPGDCGGGLCTDGYTAFCCEINQGINGCPTDTFVGGWWMCTDYPGHQLCREAGVRYYIDCNAIPGHPFPGGCRCADDNCSRRRVNCNVFRYGQCNTHIRGTTPVVCRVVTCKNPSTIPELNCGSTLMIDDAVCGHEAGCLEPPAVQLPGAGGA